MQSLQAAALVVEGLAGLTDTLLTRAKSAEVLGRLGNRVGEKLQCPISE